jgi:hypothetical protein
LLAWVIGYNLPRYGFADGYQAGLAEMSASRFLPEDELAERGLAALIEALGPVEALRFLTLPRARRVESVKRHRAWQATLDRRQFFDRVFNPRKPANGS